MLMDNINRLRQLYAAIHDCRTCPAVIPGVVPREVVEGASDSEIVLIAQAPSETGVRKSGRHWVGSDSKLHHPGGVFLDKYLRLIRYSIDPSEEAFQKPYTTNVLHCWTGRKSKRDRQPSPKELSNCRSWWLKEFEIIKPKVVLLLGKPAAESFTYACGESASFFELLRRQGEYVSFDELALRRFVVPHPTAPYFAKSTLYYEVIQKIGNVLGERWGR